MPLILVTSLALTLAGCGVQTPAGTSEASGGSEASSGEAEAKLFKLGVLGPFSGPSARSGEGFKDAVTMALEATDDQIGHYTIEPISVDSQSDAA